MSFMKIYNIILTMKFGKYKQYNNFLTQPLQG